MKQKYCFDCFACPCEVIVCSDDAIVAKEISKLAESEAKRIEKKYSRYRKDTITHKINNANGQLVQVDDETSRLLTLTDELYSLSNGLFDITAGVLNRVWDFKQHEVVPEQADIDECLLKVGWNKALWNPPELTLGDGMQLDFGGIGKEYAVDCSAKKIMEVYGDAIPVLINYGGDLISIAQPDNSPNSSDGSYWLVGIEDSKSFIRLKRGAVASSGSTKKYIVHKGKRYSHILNPLTGYPATDSGFRSITVCGDSCLTAGFLATISFMKGKDAVEFLRAQNVEYYLNRV